MISEVLAWLRLIVWPMLRALLLYTAMGVPAAFLSCLAALWVWHRWGAE